MKKNHDPRWAPMLYSMGVFPGLGQFRLGHKVRAGIFAGLTLICLLGFFVQFFTPFQQVLTSHLAPELYGNAKQAPELLRIVARWLALLFVVWLAAGIDAYIMAGRASPETLTTLKGRKKREKTAPELDPNLPPPPTPGMKR